MHELSAPIFSRDLIKILNQYPLALEPDRQGNTKDIRVFPNFSH